MCRSSKKVPFVDREIVRKINKMSDSFKQLSNVYSRRSVILPKLIGAVVHIHTGRKFVPVTVNESMLGHKLGEFAATRTYYGHGADQKAKRKKK